MLSYGLGTVEVGSVRGIGVVLLLLFLRLFFVVSAQVAPERTAFAACGTVLYTTGRWDP